MYFSYVSDFSDEESNDERVSTFETEEEASNEDVGEIPRIETRNDVEKAQRKL